MFAKSHYLNIRVPALAGIPRWYIPIVIRKNNKGEPATAGIFWWYPLRRTNHLYIICTKLKIFSAFLQANTRQFPDGYF